MNRAEYCNGGAKLTAKRGSELPHAKLDLVKVKAIRLNKHGKTAKQLALEFGVHYRTIEKVRAWEIWVHE